MADTPPTGPLAGLRVIDASTVLAGPYCTMLLGDLGAEVIKIEPPEGDSTRGWGPPWVGEPGVDGRRTAAYYLAVNRNKRGLRLDLKTPDGAEILRRLLVGADVLVENLRVGAFARLGFDEATLAALNPALVHLAITGYGTSGPAADRPGYDFIIQATSGLMSITGAPDAEGGADQGRRGDQRRRDRDARRGRGAGGAGRSRARRGRRCPTRPAGRRLDPRCDLGQPRQPGAERVRGGRGARAARATPTRTSSRTRRSTRPTARSRSRSGPSGNGGGCARRSACPTSPRIRGSRRTASGSSGAASSGRSWPRGSASGASADWTAALEAGEIPVGPINDVVAAFASPEASALGMTVEQEHPAWGVIRQVGIPFRSVRDAGLDPDAAAGPRRGHRRRSWASSATGQTRSRRIRGRSAGSRSRAYGFCQAPGTPERSVAGDPDDSCRIATARAPGGGTTSRPRASASADQDDRRDRPGPARPRAATGAPAASATAGRGQPTRQEPARVRDRRHDRQDEQRPEPDPGRRGRRAGHRRGEERDGRPGRETQPGQHRDRDPAADRQRLEQDGRVDPADRDGQHDAQRQHDPESDDLRAEERPATDRLGQHERGRAPIPFRGHRRPSPG